MLAHQLPVLPAIDNFIASLGDLFDWLGGHDLARLEPAPAVRSVTTDDTWIAPPTMTRWPGGVPLEQIRFAGANHLLVDLQYQGTSRLIEPYALRRSQAGNLLVYAIKAGTGEVRAYRVDRIEDVRVTDRGFVPSYIIELSAALPVTTGRRGPLPGVGRQRR